MKRFKFRLQRVLDYRTALKKEQERLLAERNHSLRTAEGIVQEILNAQENSPAPAETQTMAEMALIGAYQQRLTEELLEQRILVLEAAKAVEEAREAYIERAVEAESLERLKSRNLEEHKEEQHRSDRKQVNEIVVQRHGSATPLKRGGTRKGARRED